ncbi:ABC transporter permease [Nocardia seriolae]|uniref:ABC transporter permease n=1 Tax=Nocardia seriolae TaxID=37332 RepID=A0ABC9YN52_9NOCA|nr:ABC transporter permease [Nocardia seriolae]GEM22552.1 metal ABC transporter substrate-binding protein [Nocardia seriolae NBRC 15557]BEK91589.1 zinc ABC transporter substrate-binding protein [Nocardia seriolae]BEK99585.1 zinc ABC transporter substrate-binding protein [Nocardia seriolae]GAM44821.1 ABC transporter permease [Nocardia seriolae]
MFAAGLATVATLTACGSAKSSDQLSVVASTNVWGDITKAVAGPDVQVESIISDPSVDPHSFEVSPADAAKITDAKLVVYNGGHYDEFIDKAIAGKDKKTVNAFDIATEGDHDHGTGAAAPAPAKAETAGHDHEANEHVWYNVHQVGHIAEHIADALGQLDPEHKQAYTDRAAAFAAKLAPIEAVTAKIAAEHPNQPVLQTEPLAAYMLTAAKADDKTPHAFQEAVEQGTDPAPADVAAVRDLLTAKQVRALVYNVQTEDKLTKELRATADKSGVTVVEVTETLPAGQDYVTWMTGNAQSLAKALA